MDFPIPPEFWWSTDILLSSILLQGVDQKIHGRIDSVKINPSPLMMRECTMHIILWCWDWAFQRQDGFRVSYIFKSNGSRIVWENYAVGNWVFQRCCLECQIAYYNGAGNIRFCTTMVLGLGLSQARHLS